jgi:hypothetical protein
MYTYDKNIESKVRDLLQWSEDQYNELVLETGIQYLEAMAPEYKQVTRQISKSEIFWNWWRSHWQRRDEQFLEECETWHTTLEKYRTVYRNHNDAKMLLANVYLNSNVLHESYAQLFDQITKKQTQAA